MMETAFLLLSNTIFLFMRSFKKNVSVLKIS
jgi:hypothetical protein